MTMEVVDGYCHCGLSKYRPIEDVKRVMNRFGVSCTVLVQHLGEYDNSYIEDIVAGEPDRFAGVMMINTGDPAAEADLAYWAGKNVFGGIRLLAYTLGTHPDIWRRAADFGLNIVVYDEPTIASYADLLVRFTGEHPNTRVILSHLGMPDMREPPRFQSHDRILSLASHSNVFVQISGLHMFGKSPYGRLVPLVQRLVETFGPERLLYGSNYPVMNDEAVYGEELDLLRTGRLGVPAETTHHVVMQTAMDLWFA